MAGNEEAGPMPSWIESVRCRTQSTADMDRSTKQTLMAWSTLPSLPKMLLRTRQQAVRLDRFQVFGRRRLSKNQSRHSRRHPGKGDHTPETDNPDCTHSKRHIDPDRHGRLHVGSPSCDSLRSARWGVTAIRTAILLGTVGRTRARPAGHSPLAQ